MNTTDTETPPDNPADTEATDAGTTDTAASTSRAKKIFIGALAFPLFMMLAMPLLYSWGLHSPTPHDMKVAVIGSTAQTQQLAGALDTKADDKFEVSTVTDPASAVSAIKNLELRGAWDPATGNVYVASAGGVAASTAADSFLSAVAEEQGKDKPVNTIDIRPPNANDKLANTVMFVGLAAVLGAFTSASVLRMAVSGLSLRVELLILNVLGLVVTIIPLFVAYSLYGTFDSGFIKAFVVLFLGVMTVGCFHLGLMRLIGPAAILPTIIIMILIGVPASGAAIPAEMVPSTLGMLNRMLPTPALFDGLKRIVYFPDASLGATLSALALWGLIGLAMIGLAALRHTNDPDAGDPRERRFRHYFGDNHTVSDEQMTRRKTLAGAVVMPIFMALVMPLVFIGLFHSPAPHEMKVAIVSPDKAASQELIGQLRTTTGDSFDFQMVADSGAARDKLERLDIRGAYDPATGTLMTAHAGNAQSAAAVEALFTGVAAQSGHTLQVDDIAPLPDSDLVGAGVLYLGLGAILGGYLTALVVFMLGGGVGLGWHAGAIVGMSAITALTQVLISYQWLGILHNNEWTVFAVLFLISLTCAIVQYGGSLLIGPAMLIASLLLLIFLGVATSGIAISMDMAPAFYRTLHPILPTANGFEALKRIAYFDGTAASGNLWVVIAWLAAGLVMTAGGLALKRAGRGPAAPALNMLADK